MGLLDFFNQGNPGTPGIVNQGPRGLLDISPEEKKAAMSRAWLNAGLNILAADPSRGGLAAIAEGGMQGLNSYQDDLARARQTKMQGYQFDRQQKQDQQADTTFNNQQTVFNQAQDKTAAMKEMAKKYMGPNGSFDTQGYVNELYQYDPKEALDYQEKIDLAKERSAQMKFQHELSNKAQFGGQEIMKDEAGNLFYGTTIRDPRSQQIVPSVVAVDGSGVKPLGRLMIANNAYGLTANENIDQRARETAAGKVGEDSGTASAGLGSYEAQAKATGDAIDALLKHEGRYGATGLHSMIPVIPGTSQADFVNQLDQVQGQSFMQAFQALKGAGAITEQEGQKATAALSRLNRKTSDKEFNQAAADLKSVINTGVENMRKRAARSTNQGAPTQPDFSGFKVIR